MVHTQSFGFDNRPQGRREVQERDNKFETYLARSKYMTATGSSFDSISRHLSQTKNLSDIFLQHAQEKYTIKFSLGK